jgi:hypothetical protein
MSACCAKLLRGAVRVLPTLIAYKSALSQERYLASVDNCPEGFADGRPINQIDFPDEVGFVELVVERTHRLKWDWFGSFDNKIKIGPRLDRPARPASEDENFVFPGKMATQNSANNCNFIIAQYQRHDRERLSRNSISACASLRNLGIAAVTSRALASSYV